VGGDHLRRRGKRKKGGGNVKKKRKCFALMPKGELKESSSTESKREVFESTGKRKKLISGRALRKVKGKTRGRPNAL